SLDTLEQCPEVTGAEARIPLALYDFVEEGARFRLVVKPCRILEEDLQQVGVLTVPVDEHLELCQRLDAFVNRSNAEPLKPLRQKVVIALRRGHELDATFSQPAHGL